MGRINLQSGLDLLKNIADTLSNIFRFNSSASIANSETKILFGSETSNEVGFQVLNGNVNVKHLGDTEWKKILASNNNSDLIDADTLDGHTWEEITTMKVDEAVHADSATTAETATTAGSCTGNAATSSSCSGNAATASYANSAGSAGTATYAGSTASATVSGSCTGNAATASNADMVDNHHASDFLNPIRCLTLTTTMSGGVRVFGLGSNGISGCLGTSYTLNNVKELIHMPSGGNIVKIKVNFMAVSLYINNVLIGNYGAYGTQTEYDLNTAFSANDQFGISINDALAAGICTVHIFYRPIYV